MVNRQHAWPSRALVFPWTGARDSFCALMLAALLFAGCGRAPVPAKTTSSFPAPPPGVTEIRIDRPKEVSGLAAHPSGVIVVGDEQPDYGFQWPSGGIWQLPHYMPDCESIDIGMAAGKMPLVFAISEDLHTVRDSDGGVCVLDKKNFKERHNRGIEGVAARPASRPDMWDVAVVWEGGFNQSKDGWSNARVALFLPWTRGSKANKPTKVIELDIPVPSKGQRFRATDIIWHGDGVSVLLGATSKHGKAPYSHTWIQRFDLSGKRAGTPLKLEAMPRYKQAWQKYRAGRNWEALDWSLDGMHVLLGYDADGASVVCKILYPQH